MSRTYETIPSTTVLGLLEAAERGSVEDYYQQRWTAFHTQGRRAGTEYVGRKLGELHDRGLVTWSGDVCDVKLTPFGVRYLAWLRGGRLGPKPNKESAS